MEGASTEGMSAQAQQIWGMLDDMAQNNPAAYRNFIQKQLKDGKEYMAPPEPHMCVHVLLLTKPSAPLFINFCAWKRIPEPKSSQDPVPVTGTTLSQEKDKKGSFSLASVAFHPRVLEEYGRNAKNPADGDTLIQLALDYIEAEQKVKVARTYTILPEDTPYKGDLEFVQLSLSKRLRKQDDQFDHDMSELEKTFGPMAEGEKDTLMAKLSNLTVSENKKHNGNVNSNREANGFPSIQITNTPKQPSKKGLIEEIGGSSYSAENGKKYPTPKYNLEPCELDTGRCLELRVELPGVMSVAECELDISEDDVQLIVPDQYELKVKLPSCIDDDAAQAKFRKKTSVLTVIMPVKT
ncbi:PIH1 domain-containing protein 2 [Aplysia californica]|uniref:PIH1 domain-containing protein 2 n=1 Tax=Aplysia californica TaxID=6500 RepID=A0ABM0K6V2_APLCA|nr:PIH1 domain-containing protein 2 [Aplysia californica]XP_005110124.1 PIH1 domain-containing protein 2 [Aplysia californica]